MAVGELPVAEDVRAVRSLSDKTKPLVELDHAGIIGKHDQVEADEIEPVVREIAHSLEQCRAGPMALPGGRECDRAGASAVAAAQRG